MAKKIDKSKKSAGKALEDRELEDRELDEVTGGATLSQQSAPSIQSTFNTVDQDMITYWTGADLNTAGDLIKGVDQLKKR